MPKSSRNYQPDMNNKVLSFIQHVDKTSNLVIFLFPLHSFCFSVTVLGFSCGCNSIQCKTGWQEWNNACYKLFTDQKPFLEASAICKNDSANLVSIHSAQENEFVRSLLGNKDVFVGFSDSDVEATFVWVDGSTVTYTNWATGEPNDDNSMEDCVIVIGTSGKWNDTPCIMWYEFMCKFTEAQPSGGKGNITFISSY